MRKFFCIVVIASFITALVLLVMGIPLYSGSLLAFSAGYGAASAAFDFGEME